MNSPTGQEFALENINRRETSIIVRKTGMDTLVQRNGGGTPVIVEITDAVKAQLLELWGQPIQSQPTLQVGDTVTFGEGVLHNFPSRSAVVVAASDEPAKRRGRPPKGR